MADSCLSELQILIGALRAAKDTICNVILHTGAVKPNNWSNIARDVKRDVQNAINRFNDSDCECHHMPLQLPRCQAAKLTAQWMLSASDDELWETGGHAIRIQRAPGEFARAASEAINDLGRFLSGAAEMGVMVVAILLMFVLGAFGLDGLVPQF